MTKETVVDNILSGLYISLTPIKLHEINQFVNLLI
jgi:hypothetical protein